VRAKASCTVLMIPRSQVVRLMRQSASANRMIRAAFRDRLQTAIQRSCPLLTALDPEESLDLLQQLRPARAKPGQRLVTRGEMADGLYVVLLGELELRDKADSEPRVLVHGDFLGPGLSVLRQRPSQVEVTSRTFSQLLRLPAERFPAMAEKYPELLELLGG
jgi:CRP-like cAMP-binding protein